MSEQEGKIIWLASYPKSGNTWLRIFLSNLMSGKDEPVDINLLQGGPIASARPVFDELIGIESSHLTKEEIDFYLPKAHSLRASKLTNVQFVKSHDAYTLNESGVPIIPEDATFKAIYLLRNPLDVCVSFAHHAGHSNYTKMLKGMNNPKYVLANSKKSPNNQLHQKMGTWSDHVRSWQNGMPTKTLMIRYEDMKHNSLETFSKIVKFSELEYSQEAIEQALEFSSMSKLQEQEKEKGFRERLAKSKSFFRKGVTGSWRDELTDEQAQLIIEQHKDVMEEFGYLDATGEPIY